MNKYGIKKNFGFGCMRLPKKDGDIDYEEVCRLFDTFLENGFNYFDTAHGYHSGLSEVALRKCLTSRHDRSEYLITDKLSHNFFSTNEDIRPLFEEQLKATGVDYFDFYLMHAQDEKIYEQYRRCRAYEEALKLLEEGKIRHFGISFHDRAEVLEKILTDWPEIEVVQIQFNYLDYEDASVQSKRCYEICREHGKDIIIMEPVKGGSLAKLPEEAQAVIDSLGGGSAASYALRFAASFEGVIMVLSGMGSMEMVEDNIGTMKDFVPLTDAEMSALGHVCEIFRQQNLIPCTACRYCTEVCPAGIPIPEIFACLNSKEAFGSWNSNFYYGQHTANGPKASDCLGCGACEETCPQHIEIRDLLQKAAEVFEKKD